MVKNLPGKEETQVLSLGWEDPLKQEMATLPSVLAWRIPLIGLWRAVVHRVTKELARFSD